MNKKKLIIGTMIAVVLFSLLLKLTLIPGRGILTVIITCSASMLFFIVPIRKVISNSIKGKEETKGPAYANVLEVFYAMFLSSFTIGILFKLMHWPGANLMLSVGFIPTIICACLVLLTYKTTNCAYFSSARAIAIATLLYALLFGTQHYYHFIETIRWKGSDLLEYYNNLQADPSENTYRIFITERTKLLDLKDKEEYNSLNKEYQKAQAEAKETGAKVLYILGRTVYDTETPNEVFFYVGIYEPEDVYKGIEIEKYLTAIASSEKTKYNKFILVTDNEYTIHTLENTQWQSDSFSVKYGNEIYKFGPNMQQ